MPPLPPMPPDTEFWVGYGYDSVTGRPNSISSSLFPGTSPVTYGYLANSDALETATFPNGLVVTRAYEDHRDLVASLENKVGATVVSKYEYTYDDAGRRTAAVRSGTAFTATDTLSYGYNTRSEVTSAASSEVATNDYSYLFDYDPMGNRLLATRGLAAPATTAYATSNVNAYTDVTTSTGTINPAYDEDGNVDFLPAAAGSGAADWSFTWDAENRLVVAESATVRIEMAYDYLSRRVAKKVYTGSTTAGWTLQSDTRFLYDGWNLIAEIDATATAPTIWYVWGLDQSQSVHGAGGIGGLLCSSLPTVYASNVYYTFDGNGNVSELVDGTGAAQAHYEFDPYGKAVVATGALAADNPFRFSTKYLDSDTGFHYYGYRWYSTDLGRWLSRDPLQEDGGINLLAFCGNDGVNGFDPDGLAEWTEAPFGPYPVLKPTAWYELPMVSFANIAPLISNTMEKAALQQIRCSPTVVADSIDWWDDTLDRATDGEVQLKAGLDQLAYAVPAMFGPAAFDQMLMGATNARWVAAALVEQVLPKVRAAVTAKRALLIPEARSLAQSAETCRSCTRTVAPRSALRQQYQDAVGDLATYADEFLSKGASEEQAARLMQTARRELGVMYKDMTPPDLLEYIHRFNVDRYGDPLGPTYEFLTNVRGKTPAQIIESASRPLGDSQQLGRALQAHFGEEIVPVLKKYGMLD